MILLIILKILVYKKKLKITRLLTVNRRGITWVTVFYEFVNIVLTRNFSFDILTWQLNVLTPSCLIRHPVISGSLLSQK